jgi:hypothetical protein
MSTPAPWLIRKLPHLMTGAFVLAAFPAIYSSTFSDVSPAHYQRLSGVVEDHPQLARNVADALEDHVITHGEYTAIVDEGRRLSAIDARDRLRAAAQTTLVLDQALSDAVPLSANP